MSSPGLPAITSSSTAPSHTRYWSHRLHGKADQPARPSLDVKRVDKLTVLGGVVNNSLMAKPTMLPGQVYCTPDLRVLRCALSDQSRRVSCYGDWEVDVLCASLAWFLFCRLRATAMTPVGDWSLFYAVV